MKILLVNPPTRAWRPPNCFPTGLAMIAQVLREDHDVQIVDLNILRMSYENPEDLLAMVDRETDVVGITGLITNYATVKMIIGALKYFLPNVPIIVGGALGSSIPEIMLRKAGADICVIGEGEETAVDLFKQLGWARDGYGLCAGIAYLNDHDFFIETPPRKPIKDIDTLPLPAYDLFDTDSYAMYPVGSSINPNKWHRELDGPPHQKLPTGGQNL
jgi:radical SAM superfamily enzyme YgiQ (UPF0313 family)